MPHRHPGRAAILLVTTVVALLVGGAGGYLGRPYLAPAVRPTNSTSNEGVTEAIPVIAALARLQPRDGVIPVYGPPGDRVGRLYDGVAAGKWLNAGDPIADLASRAERDTEVAVAEVQLTEARTQLDRAKAAGRTKLAAARAEAEQATADEEQDRKALALQIAVLDRQKKYADDQVQRLQKLSADGVRVADEEREQANLLAAKAAAEAEGARIKRQKAEDGYRRGRTLAEAKLAAAEADAAEAVARVPIDSAAKKLDLAKQLSALTTLKAPVAGTVLKVASRAGEPTGAQQPVVYLADTTHMVAVAEVYESDVPALWDGLARGRTFTAAVTSPALPKDRVLTGVIRSEDQLSRMIARNAIFALSPREDSDRRVVEAVVDLDPESSKLAAHSVGLQVSVELTPAGGGK